MFVVLHRKIFYTFTALLVLLAVVSIGIFGIQFGVDFTGGSLLEATYTAERPLLSDIDASIDRLALGETSIRPAGEQGVFVRSRALSEAEHQALLNALTVTPDSEAMEDRFTTVGPVIGDELANKAVFAVALAVLVILVFIAFAFRKVSKPVSSWVYGVIAVITLLHDIIIPAGAFALLGYVTGAEAGVLFIMALLAILGYSINDTIVVFDRVRENLLILKEKGKKENFELTVGASLSQTYVRSINTSLTTAIALLALFFLGPAATQDFALTLLVGVIAGTYSSIFLASPLLVSLAKRFAKEK